ncbi:zinc finger C2H2-type/integrase DNA-binding domain-containing protein [Artemisia annua]|uniref:Zinc finger C2H2-type/integrase DNA-binding domain-containing protein n=1 Tax=Artemisia annua TaxID=35608 RepID=A0A2U1PHE8_ARTAN|nr:zinc finger C2H2-type/integrase DNA-binding domain-containing protein [Artemisia annua]
MVNKSQLFDQDYDQDFVNGEKGPGFGYGYEKMVQKSQHFDQRYDHDFVNGEKSPGFAYGYEKMVQESQHFDQDYDQVYGEFDDGGGGYEMVKKSQLKMEVDQDYDQDDGADNVYGLRENPKRSWRVSSSNSVKDFGIFCQECGKEFSSSKALGSHKRSHSRKESNKDTICEKCGRGFDSLKALYGHMRCHSGKRSQIFDPLDEHVNNVDGGVANPIRKKRSYTRYKSPKHDNVGTSLSFSSCNDDYEVEEGAICLMMISMGVRTLDEVKLVISRQAEFGFSDCEYSRTSVKTAEFEVSVDESMEYGSFVNESELGLKEDLTVGYGSSQLKTNRVGSAMLKCKSTKTQRSCDQDFGDRDGTDSGIFLEPKRRYKDQVCAICYKKFGSAQALGSHKRIHNKAENKSLGVNSSDVEFKLTWVHSQIEWDPFAVVN